MPLGLPENEEQVESSIKVDVQREAPDSDPYLTVSWLRSLIAGLARRNFDVYGDIAATEDRLFPDTTDPEGSERWGNIYIGPKNPEEGSSGTVVVSGVVGGVVGIGVSLTASGNEYLTTSADAISNNSITITSLTRSGSIATAVTAGDHNLASQIPVTISGADQPEYNVTDAEITVIDDDAFTYPVSGAPITPATGTLLASFVTANVSVDSVDFGADTNLDPDTPLSLQSPLVNVNDTFYVTFGAIGGGTDEETEEAYTERRIEKIREPVAHFNESDIRSTAKTVPGVTRVFVFRSGTAIGPIPVTSITRNNNVATVVTTGNHNFADGQTTNITGADQSEYNVIQTYIIVEDAVTFHYVVFGAPTSPATGTINAATTVPPGQVQVYFMRDNDADPIPSASEVQDVKDALDEISPANTQQDNLFVAAPTAVPVDYTFTNIVPDTPTMRTAIENSLQQFHAEETFVGIDVDEDKYRAAIANTVDLETGDDTKRFLQTFTLSAPVGDVPITTGQIATLGTVSFPP